MINPKSQRDNEGFAIEPIERRTPDGIFAHRNDLAAKMVHVHYPNARTSPIMLVEPKSELVFELVLLLEASGRTLRCSKGISA